MKIELPKMPEPSTIEPAVDYHGRPCEFTERDMCEFAIAAVMEERERCAELARVDTIIAAAIRNQPEPA